MNIGTLPARHAKYRGDHLALVFGETRLTFRQFNAEINRLAHALSNAGIVKGSKIATVLPNCIELMNLYWAAAKIGAVVVPSSTLLQPAGLVTLIQTSDTEMVFSTPSFVETLDQVKAEVADIPDDRWILVGEGEAASGYATYAAFVDGEPTSEPPDPGIHSEDPYNIIFSSGTTGAPKGIVHTHEIRGYYCTVFASAWRMTPESVVMHAGSIVFNGAFLSLMPWMFLGCTYVLLPGFDAAEVIDTVDKERVTHTIMVPSQIVAMMNAPEFAPERLGSLEMLLTLGAPLLIEQKQRLVSLLPGCFYELYGLTEGFMTVLDKYDIPEKMSSVGAPSSFNEVKIIGEDGNELPPNTNGEIVARGPLLMPGYYKRDDLTAETVRDGWLYTGDIGYLDEDGYLYLVDRKKEMIISGGVNVYPRDIEEIAVTHPNIVEAAVFGVPDEKWGETPVAAVTVDGAVSDAADVLRTWINDRVEAKFQRLSDLIVLTELPRNVAGKTLKRDIKSRYLDGR